jgi:uroporphyrinogen-III synthase
MEDSKKDNIPIFLLKTKSTPIDGYEEHFSKFRIGNRTCKPVFAPVLEHRFNVPHLQEIKQSLVTGQVGNGGKYGGIVFTSQRAVEAFRHVVHDMIGR